MQIVTDASLFIFSHPQNFPFEPHSRRDVAHEQTRVNEPAFFPQAVGIHQAMPDVTVAAVNGQAQVVRGFAVAHAPQ